MTCAFGATPADGVAPTKEIALDRAAWEVLTGTPSTWFDWILGVYVTQFMSAADLCTLNPSDPALPSVITIAKAFFRDPSSILDLYAYVRAKLIYLAFSVNCVCLPDPLAPPTCATGWASSFTPTPAVGPSGGPNGVGTKFTSLLGGAQFSGFRVWVPQAYNYDVGLTLWDSSGTMILGDTIVGGFSAGYHEFAVTPVTLTAGHDYIVEMCVQTGYQWYESATAPTNDSVATWVSHLYKSGSGCSGMPDTTSGGWEGIQPLLCTSGAVAPTTPVVPSEPDDLPVPPPWSCATVSDVCVRLQQISERLDWLIRSEPSVTNSSLAEGTVHAGLTGTGTLVVSGILGVRVLLTTIPPQYGGTVGTPTLHFGLGRVDWMTAEGWTGRRYLSDTPLEQVFTTPSVSSIGYSLAGGIVATIVELVKGP